MEARAIKKPTAFRLDENLIAKLKEEAKKANRSLNNYVECILMERVYAEPNETTLNAIEEAKVGKFAGKVDTSSFDSFVKSIE